MLSTFERIFCIILLLGTTLIGFLGCVYIIIYAIFYSKVRTIFYKICVFKSIANFSALCVFLFWIGPLIITADPSSGEGVRGFVSKLCFVLCTRVYEILLWVSLILAVNRFVAILFWNYYDRIFNTKIIYCVLGLITAYKIYSGYQHFSIKIVYRGDLMNWENLSETENGIVYDVFIVIGLACFFNIITLFYVVYIAVIRKTAVNPSKKLKENSLLFVQAFLQDLVFCVDITFMFILSGLWNNPIFQFICANYTSVVVHTIDGLIMLFFQRHMLEPVFKLLGFQKQDPSTASSWAAPRPTAPANDHP